MPSTLTKITHERDIQGMFYQSPAHLIQPGKWRTVMNMRTAITGFEMVGPRREFVTNLGDTEPILEIVAFPVGRKKRCLFTAFTKSKAYQVKFVIYSPVRLKVDGVLTDFASDPGSIEGEQHTRRWGGTMYNNQFWFSNHLNKMMVCDGAQIKTLGSDVPQGKYVESFFDHIVVANDIFMGDQGPNRVRWSELYNPSEWVPKPENEADYFDIAEWTNKDVNSIEITGLKKLNDTLIVYTHNSIIGCRYVGKPKVMYFFPISQDVGNTLQWGLATYKNMHFFFSENDYNFYMFNGEVLKPIGEPILEYFTEVLGTGEITSTWAFVWPEFNEVWWVINSDSESFFYDDAVVFNWRTGEWYATTITKEMCFGPRGTRAKTMDDLSSVVDTPPDMAHIAAESGDLLTTESGDVLIAESQIDEDDFITIDELTGTQMNNLNEGGEVLSRFFGTNDSNLHTLGGTLTGTTQTIIPFLESRDMYHDDLHSMKEYDGVFISTTSPNDQGIQVELSARNYLNEPVVFQKVGTWNSNLSEGRLTFNRVPGKIFRWRFTPRASQPLSWEWFSFTECVYLAKTEK